MAINVVHYFLENYMTHEAVRNDYKLNHSEEGGCLPARSVALCPRP